MTLRMDTPQPRFAARRGGACRWAKRRRGTSISKTSGTGPQRTAGSSTYPSCSRSPTRVTSSLTLESGPSLRQTAARGDGLRLQRRDTGNGTGGGKGSGGPAAAADPKLIDHITGRACQFLEDQAANGGPFYLQISHYAVHLDIFYRQATFDLVQPWKAGKKHYFPPFAAMTADMDASIGKVLDKIDELGLDRNTYVFFLSDNGGRGTLPGAGEPPVPRNHPCVVPRGRCNEGGIRVPFLVAGPGIKSGSVNRTPVTGLDILPTLADLAGYPEDLPATVDGGSLRDVLHGGRCFPRARLLGLPPIRHPPGSERDPPRKVEVGQDVGAKRSRAVRSGRGYRRGQQPRPAKSRRWPKSCIKH